jgi:hypothetical protein
VEQEPRIGLYVMIAVMGFCIAMVIYEIITTKDKKDNEKI